MPRRWWITHQVAPLVCLMLVFLSSARPGRVASPGVGGSMEVAPERRKRRKRWTPQTPDERLMWALGCELWLAGRDVALASRSVLRGEIGATAAPAAPAPRGGTRSHLPTVLQEGGSALQEAGAAFLDARWSSAMVQLERVAQTSQEYWPSRGFDDLIALVFATSLRRGSVSPARSPADSLEHLAQGLDAWASGGRWVVMAVTGER
ncbi:unnamed protein product [Durusdinium trenchii]|uniref:Uncharacterized protein n=1 Tax=Durusdinium trenchii TaxID=1381693 RepID=A0ABP0P9Q1_9DINO